MLREVNKSKIHEKIVEINTLHPSLKFTIKCENDCSILFLNINTHDFNVFLIGTRKADRYRVKN